MYGLEAPGKSLSELFGEKEAAKALGEAKMVFGSVKKLLRQGSS